MTRKNAKLTVKPGHLNARHLSFEDLSLRRDNFQVNQISHIGFPPPQLIVYDELHCATAFNRFLDSSHHKEGLLRQVVVNAGDQLLEAANRIFQSDELAFQAGELFRNMERLGEKLLGFPAPRKFYFIFVDYVVVDRNRYYVLKI